MLETVWNEIKSMRSLSFSARALKYTGYVPIIEATYIYVYVYMHTYMYKLMCICMCTQYTYTEILELLECYQDVKGGACLQ